MRRVSRESRVEIGTDMLVKEEILHQSMLEGEADVIANGHLEPTRPRNWTSPLTVLKSVGPKLVPFCKTVAIYFVLSLPETSPILLRCLTKCAPIISLVIFVLLHGISLSKEYAFARAILCGLVMSLLGDVLLCYNLLKLGMLCFGLAHANYIRAFGLRPLKLYVLLVLAVLAVAAYWYLLPGLQWPLCLFVAVYNGLIATMAWRALARVQLFGELWTWTKLCSSAGAVLFMVSDFLLASHKFLAPLRYERELVMGTYYAAQLGIALSVVDSRKASKTD